MSRPVITPHRIMGRALLLGLVVAACASERPLLPGDVYVSPSEVFLGIGDTVTLSLIGPGGAPITEEVMWSVDDRDVAEISFRGRLTAVGIGATVARAGFRSVAAEADVTVGPWIIGSWLGEADSLTVLLNLNASTTPSGVTGLGSAQVGNRPSVFVSAYGTAARDSVRLTVTGTMFDLQYHGGFVDVDLVGGTAILNRADTLQLEFHRIGT